MNSKLTTAKVIDDLLQSPHAAGMDARSQYLFRESLYSLVRLARAEQLLEIKSNVAKLTGLGAAWNNQEAMSASSQPSYISIQQQFEFHDPDC